MPAPSTIEGSLEKTRPAASVHLLPCKIEHSGKAAVGKSVTSVHAQLRPDLPRFPWQQCHPCPCGSSGMNSDEEHQCFCRAVCGVCNGHIRHGVALNLAGRCRYFDALVREDVDGKRALTLPLDTVREQYACHPVEVSGESSVDNAVSPKTMVQATFRGRRLKGARMNLPKDYVGVVLKQGRVTHSDEQHKTWEPLVKFDKFTYWNLDQLPGKNDPIAQAMEWVDLARAVHTDSDSELPRRSPRKSPLKDYTNEGSPKKKRTKLDVTN